MYTPNKYEVFIEKMSEKTNKYLVTLNTVDFPEAIFPTIAILSILTRNLVQICF